MTKKAAKPSEEKELEEVAAEHGAETKSETQKPKKKQDDETDKETEEEQDKASVEEKVDVVEQDDELKEIKTEVEELKQRLEETEQSEKEWHGKYLRLSAEFDNYRKRTLKEKTELAKQANADLLKDLLSVVDDFERGMDSMEKSEDVAALKEGVHLIYNKFIEFTGQNGIKEIKAKELDFDIDFHEAITKIPAPSEDMKGKVVDVIEKGYLLNEKVIRYAKVVVGE